ncbi:MAG: hypothetical protein EXS36_19890 [Pedosphaera sp.]|nr:hypothetical protein [Pedosphaera sp.]
MTSGAKFGFYAVGLAKRYSSSSVIAFDTDWWAREAVLEMAVANNTKNIDVKGFCTPDWIAENTAQDAFIISDCEGYEDVLFRHSTVSRLKSATLIIETHDCFAPGVCERLRKVFGGTHTVRKFNEESPRLLTNRRLDFLLESEVRLAIQEVRPPQTWLLCLPNTGPNKEIQNFGRK